MILDCICSVNVHVVYDTGPAQITSRGKRIYYISKDCDTKQGCERRQASQQTTCRRSWMNDWACTECCYDDLCNYFVTLNGDEVSVSASSVVITRNVMILFARWRACIKARIKAMLIVDGSTTCTSN